MNSGKILAVVALLLTSIASSGICAEVVIFDVPQVAGKSQDQVSKIIGKPESCEQSKYGQNCTYAKAGTEIVFINGKADWITINEMPGAKYDKNSLSLLGIPVKAPTFVGVDSMRWENIPGFLEISLFPQGSSIFYAYVKTKTK